ncbi:Gp138 family membrane-puncturing spike protein [Paenibacillus macquariensis]|uniref:Phage protein Gp138 N-terminal domain-containing protein n=1 Tax=Paenibacillus macquariensis TaxID=948756 RepID=A0ABY1JSF9_9BACL|nr:Gp138 family membrane-puncturing spike protein [Paenibacillus macquariensis]MEC0092892.1 Gp138 family membrane-puncturing spike protein [Paenibacillus macquariensis]OAB36263.1 hypothetical protein PMSM_07395 [Paenibacillus macquariensis subsp. macquariensis]SIQ68247.1 hypothetical protein SAMN05421578_103346 [Paenibacillus macquariensis]
MKNDPASTLSQVISSMVLQYAGGIHVGFPCRVISFNESTCRADLQPLIKSSDTNPAMIQNVPALGHRYKINGSESVCTPFLKVGDTVFVVCADNEIKNALTGSVASADTSRTHDVNDAVIVGVLPCSL